MAEGMTARARQRLAPLNEATVAGLVAVLALGIGIGAPRLSQAHAGNQAQSGGQAQSGNQAQSGGQTAATPAATATVTRRDLARVAKVTGRLGYGTELALAARSAGTATWLPAVGLTIAAGEPLYVLDGTEAVTVFKGNTPAWRSLDDSSSSGVDIEALEANLVALGFDPTKAITVNTSWSSATTAAVKRWQKKLGVKQTGRVDLGRVVFLPDPVRIAGVDVDPGALVTPGSKVVTVTATQPEIQIDLDAADQGRWRPGAAVSIRLPDDTTTTGRVAKVGTVASGGGQDAQGQPQKATVPVTVALDDPAKATFDGATVSVSIVTEERKGVLAVPVAALLALAEGGFGVELASTAAAAPGTSASSAASAPSAASTPSATTIIAVTTGLFADGFVEVSGNIAAGDLVVIPS